VQRDGGEEEGPNQPERPGQGVPPGPHAGVDFGQDQDQQRQAQGDQQRVLEHRVTQPLIFHQVGDPQHKILHALSPPWS
jgi:hypothetical protein